MANTPSNVLAGRPLSTGGILIAPLGTAAPTTVAAALNVAFKAVGYIGDNGVTETIDRGTTKIKAWGGDTIKIVQSDFSVGYKFSFAEALNTDVLGAVYGTSNVTTTAAAGATGTLQSVIVNSGTLPHQSFVFEIRDGNAKVRIYVPDGQITSVGDITYDDGSIIKYDVTVEAFFNATLGGQAKKFTDDGVFAP